MKNTSQSKQHQLPMTWSVWLAIGLGTGLSPVAPGTVGSLLGIPLVWGLSHLQIMGWWLLPPTLILCILGIPICASGARYFGREDPGAVVYDEIAAFPLVFLLTPYGWLTSFLGFALFRLFDIAKPWPIRHFEKIGGGLGIMLDDIIAALMAMICLKLIDVFFLT